MHLHKHIGLSDPHLPCGAGMVFVILDGGAKESRKNFNSERKKQKGERRVYVAVKTFMNPCKLVLIVFLRRYGWSLYVYGYLSKSDSINTNLQLC